MFLLDHEYFLKLECNSIITKIQMYPLRLLKYPLNAQINSNLIY